MADFAMSNMQGLPVTILLLGLLYSKEDGLVGQSGGNINLVDLCKLPITPIMVRPSYFLLYQLTHSMHCSYYCT